MYIKVKNVNGENIPYKVKRITVHDGCEGELVFHHSDVEDIFFEDEGEESFDNLVYVKPNGFCHIRVSTLSEEQKSFLDKNLVWRNNVRLLDETKKYGYLNYDGNWWLGKTCYSEQIFFNDIFKESRNV